MPGTSCTACTTSSRKRFRDGVLGLSEEVDEPMELIVVDREGKANETDEEAALSVPVASRSVSSVRTRNEPQGVRVSTRNRLSYMRTYVVQLQSNEKFRPSYWDTANARYLAWSHRSLNHHKPTNIRLPA